MLMSITHKWLARQQSPPRFRRNPWSARTRETVDRLLVLIAGTLVVLHREVPLPVIACRLLVPAR